MSVLNNLSLRIYGGTLGNGLARVPIVSVGDEPTDFMPMAPSLVDEQQTWIILHAQYYTMYALSSKRCYTQDNKQGQMLICLFLPPQQRLARGSSPLEVLEKLLDCFELHSLRNRQLPVAPVDNTPYMSLLEEYEMEPRPLQLPIMRGQAPASFRIENKSHLDALMRFSRYHSLAEVRCLELGFNCNSTISLYSNSKPSTIPEHVTAFGGELTDEPAEQKGINYNTYLTIATVLILVLCSALFYVFRTGDDKVRENSLDNTSTNVIAGIVEDSVNIISEESFNDKRTSPSVDSEVNLQERAEERSTLEEESKKHDEIQIIREAAERLVTEQVKKKENEANLWQQGIEERAKACPKQLRLGVRITSITYNATSVTYTIKYEELSKYNISASDKVELLEDQNNIINEIKDFVPKNIQVTVLQKDKVGRDL